MRIQLSDELKSYSTFFAEARANNPLRKTVDVVVFLCNGNVLIRRQILAYVNAQCFANDTDARTVLCVV